MIQLLGGPRLLGDTSPSSLMSPIDGFMLMHPNPSASNVAEFLKPYPEAERISLAQQLISRGVDAKAISMGLNFLSASARVRSMWPTISGVLAIASAGASAYHGYRRNQSIAWALWWFLMGSVFPVVTPALALAQGFGKKKAS